MGEKTEVRVWVVLGASVVLLLDAIVFYFMEGELFGPHFTGVTLMNALVVGFVLVFPQSFTRSRLRERQLEWRRNRAGRIIVVVLFGVALFSLAALLVNSYLNGYRMM